MHSDPSFGTFGYGYDGRSRMTVVQRDGSTVGTYAYNALGQRTAKVATFPAASSQRFSYDESSQLLGEYGSGSRDYIWLGALPVAVVDTSGGVSSVSYVHADGLSTPRVVTDATGASIWQLAYQGNAFGEQQPTTSVGFAYNLRFPGQYYDAESGLNYNVHRHYESATGRYDQPDPLGLAAGPSVYAYVGSNPLSRIDPYGLAPIIPNPNGTIPGGPWTPAGPGQRPGSFLGPKAPGGPRLQCEYVPEQGQGGPPGSKGYWKTKAPGQKGWSRYNLEGQSITPEEAHPGPASSEAAAEEAAEAAEAAAEAAEVGEAAEEGATALEELLILLELGG